MEIYFQNQCSLKNLFRALQPFYGVHNRLTERTIRETINNQYKNYQCIRKNVLFGAVYGKVASSDRIHQYLYCRLRSRPHLMQHTY